jgi:hypothetical protein
MTHSPRVRMRRRTRHCPACLRARSVVCCACVRWCQCVRGVESTMAYVVCLNVCVHSVDNTSSAVCACACRHCLSMRAWRRVDDDASSPSVCTHGVDDASSTCVLCVCRQRRLPLHASAGDECVTLGWAARASTHPAGPGEHLQTRTPPKMVRG